MGTARFAYANAAVTVYSTARVDDGNWRHIVAIARRDSYAQIYVDEVLARTSTPNTTALTDTSPVRIGASATAVLKESGTPEAIPSLLAARKQDNWLAYRLYGSAIRKIKRRHRGA